MDHLGIGPAVDGDSVYHGSLDNAGGTAEVITMARAFASLPSAPKRSILFVTVTGEEKGLLGSDYFVHYPPVPRDKIVADINIDNFLMLNPVKDLSAIAADYSTLARNVQEAFAQLEITLSPDPVPSEAIFTRSDQYSFLRFGIPSVFLFNGAKSGNGNQTGSEITLYWLRNIHHTPKDNMSQGIDWNAGVTFAKANFLVGYHVANQTDRPSMKGHYFFETAPAAEEKH
jgi:Zn-dependent M28 family amino/carboxypeptidase